MTTYLIGLTGNIAAGNTTVARVTNDLGAMALGSEHARRAGDVGPIGEWAEIAELRMQVS